MVIGFCDTLPHHYKGMWLKGHYQKLNNHHKCLQNSLFQVSDHDSSQFLFHCCLWCSGAGSSSFVSSSLSSFSILSDLQSFPSTSTEIITSLFSFSDSPRKIGSWADDLFFLYKCDVNGSKLPHCTHQRSNGMVQMVMESFFFSVLILMKSSYFSLHIFNIVIWPK